MGLSEVKEILIAFQTGEYLCPITVHHTCLGVAGGDEDAVAGVAVLEGADRHPRRNVSILSDRGHRYLSKGSISLKDWRLEFMPGKSQNLTSAS